MMNTVHAEVSIRTALFLSEQHRGTAVLLVRDNAEARAQYANIEQQAAIVLANEPRPLEIIYYEGILETDSRRKQTEDHLRDMDMLALVCQAYCGNPRDDYETFIRRFVHAWATTYIPTGNPINENKLEAVFCGYYLTKSGFEAATRDTIESWMKNMAGKIDQATSTNNWETKRFKILGEIGLACGDTAWMHVAVERYKSYIPNAIRDDGSTDDFHKRDAVSYHCGALGPLLVFCLIAEQMQIRIEGATTYEWQADNGGSVKKAVHFFDPYIAGEKTHMEFVNSTVAFDKQRCDAGIERYCPHLWEPSEAADEYELVAGFEPAYSTETLVDLLNSSATEYPTWLTVLTKATAIDPVGTKAAHGMSMPLTTPPSAQQNPWRVYMLNGAHLPRGPHIGSDVPGVYVGKQGVLPLHP